MSHDATIQTISHITETMNALDLKVGDIFGAIALIATCIKYLREGKYKELKAMLAKEALMIANTSMTDAEQVQHLVDFAQSKSKFLAAIPDRMLLDAVNSVYLHQIKPKAEKANLKTAKAKARAEKRKAKTANQDLPSVP